MAYHRNAKPGTKRSITVTISYDAFEKIDLQAKKHNLTKKDMVNTMIDFWIRNYVIVEQLSLSSNNRRIA